MTRKRSQIEPGNTTGFGQRIWSQAIGGGPCSALARAAFLVAALFSSTPSARGETACTKILRPLVVEVGFPDIRRAPPRELVEQRFLNEPDRYIREMSYGRVCLSGTITGRRYILPGPIAQYWVPWQNLKVDKNKLRRLVADTLDLVERDYDVSEYDFVVFALDANAREWGNQGLNTYPGLLGWDDDSSLVAPSGRKIKGGIAIYALSAQVGKVFHNIAHIIGGVKDGRRVLPDMYDQDAASASNVEVGAALDAFTQAQFNMGAWDPMSCDVCQQLPGAPGITAWTKLRLGWLDQAKVRTVNRGETADITLGALEDGSSSPLAIRLPLGPTQYYLVENRQKIGQDRNLPAAGVLIMRADDQVPEPRFGRAPVRLVNANPSVPHLDGAAFDTDGNDVFVDRENSIRLRLLRKTGNSYQVHVERGKIPDR
jgi:M6 family metalloprotease-like protein